MLTAEEFHIETKQLSICYKFSLVLQLGSIRGFNFGLRLVITIRAICINLYTFVFSICFISVFMCNYDFPDAKQGDDNDNLSILKSSLDEEPDDLQSDDNRNNTEKKSISMLLYMNLVALLIIFMRN